MERFWEALEDTSTARAETRCIMIGRLAADIGDTATRTMLSTGGESTRGCLDTTDETMVGLMMTYDLAALAALTSLICTC